MKNFLGYKNKKVTSKKLGRTTGFMSIYLFGKGSSSGNRQGGYKSFKKSGGKKNKLFF